MPSGLPPRPVMAARDSTKRVSSRANAARSASVQSDIAVAKIERRNRCSSSDRVLPRSVRTRSARRPSAWSASRRTRPACTAAATSLLALGWSTLRAAATSETVAGVPACSADSIASSTSTAEPPTTPASSVSSRPSARRVSARRVWLLRIVTMARSTALTCSSSWTCSPLGRLRGTTPPMHNLGHLVARLHVLGGSMTTEGPTGYSLGGPTTQGPTGYPIGYWLKRLDRAIDGALDATLAAEDLTRRHWQTMNFLHQGPSDAPALAEALRPFWGQGAITLDEVLRDLERRTLVANDGGRYAPTAAGTATGAKLAEQVDATRRRLVDGVTREEYLATVEVLQRMTANLEGEGAPAG